MYDAIIVGARVAGAPTAMLLARKGYRVLLVDRDTFPSDIMSTHYLHHSGVALLQRWGLLDELLAGDTPAIRDLTQDFGMFALNGSAPPAGEIDFALCPRRRVLDAILVRAAAAAGVEVREGFSVQEIVRDGDHVTGIRGRTRDTGEIVSEEARIVVGADGVHSVVARAVQPEEYNVRPAMSCGYYTYYSGLGNRHSASLYNRGDHILFEFPTNDGLTCVAMECPAPYFKEFRSDIEGYFNQKLQLVPDLAQRVAAGKREEPFVGVTDLPNFFRKPYGPGWALVGDAGYHKDPVTGRGISDAFRDADLLATALDEGFSGRQPLEQALGAYEQARNADSMAVYEITMQQVSWQPPAPETMLFVSSLVGNQEDTNRFFGIVAGTTNAAEFMSPENIGRIIGQAQARAAAAAG